MTTVTCTHPGPLPARSPRGALWRSLTIGLLASAADLGSLALLVAGLHLTPEAANVPSRLAGLVVQFVGNKWWAFRDPSRRLIQQGSQFLAVEAGALALNAAAFHALVAAAHLPFPVARIVGSAAVYLTFSYPLWRRIFGGLSR